MKVQYFGDEHDFRKYVLLRQITKIGFKIGVCWMLTPDDGRDDGKKRSYLTHSNSWRNIDPELFDLIASKVSHNKLQEQGLISPTPTHLRWVENNGLINQASYFSDFVPVDRLARMNFMSRLNKHFHDRHMIFYDPDNGTETPTTPIGRKNSIKYVFDKEISADYASGKSVLVYQHFPRINHTKFLEEKLKHFDSLLPNCSTYAFEAPQVAFILISRPEHAGAFIQLGTSMIDSKESGLYKTLHGF